MLHVRSVVSRVRIRTITLNRDWLRFGTKRGVDPCIFQKGEFYTIKSGFQSGRVHYWRSKGGGSTIGFQMRSPLSKCIYLHCPLFLRGERGALHYTLLYWNWEKNDIWNDTELITILSVGLFFVNIIIFVYGTKYSLYLRVCIVLYLYLYFSTLKLRF